MRIVTCSPRRRPFGLKAAVLLVLLILAPTLTPVLAFAQAAAAPEAGLEQAWATPAELLTPESALYDPERDVIYASNIDGEPAARDGNGFISRISSEGEILELRWVEGLDAPKGLAILDGRLFVSDIDQLVEIDIERGEIAQRRPAPGAGFLNDVAVDGSGNVYVSDSAEEHSVIYRLSGAEGAELESWLEDERLAGPNGLLALEDALVIGNSRAELLSVPYGGGELSVLAELADHLGGIDGIVQRSGNSLLVSDWNGIVVLAEAAGSTLGAAAGQAFQITPLIDVREQGINTADIGFIEDRNLLLAPTFSDNRVIAWQLPAAE